MSAAANARPAQPRLGPGMASPAGAHPPQWLGKRFDAEGRALPDGGATVIGHVRAPAAVARASIGAPRLLSEKSEGQLERAGTERPGSGRGGG